MVAISNNVYLIFTHIQLIKDKMMATPRRGSKLNIFIMEYKKTLESLQYSSVIFGLAWLSI